MIVRSMMFAAVSAISLLAGSAFAQTTAYPLTVTDMAGRQVTIPAEPTRVALQDGRDAAMLALLDRADPFKRVVVWNNLLARQDTASWKVMSGKWADAKAIPDMGFGDDGQVNTEDLVAARPGLVVAELRAEKSLRDAGVIQRLDALRIPLLFVDTFDKPVPGAADSVEILGKALNRQSEAKVYTDFYNAHLKRLTDTIAGVATRPRVFVEVLAGRQGPEQCCFTHGKVGWGALLSAIGVENIGASMLPGAAGDVTLESVISAKPDVYLFTGRMAGGASAMIPFGYDADPKAIEAALHRFAARPGFASLEAARTGRLHGIWHFFYSHPYNIVALEWLAKWSYPKEFASLDPNQTWNELIDRFTEIPPTPITLTGSVAPAAK